MAGDRKQFERAMQKWERLHHDKAYSVPDAVGRMAIFVTDYSYFADPYDTDSVHTFRQEGLLLYDELLVTGNRPLLIEKGTGDDMDAIMKDPSISSVVTIGHGALSYVYTAHGSWKRNGEKRRQGNRYGWRDVSYAADHLKTGYFIQRQCGNATNRLSVPLGAFAMATHNRVIATVNNDFAPIEPNDPENDKLTPVTDADFLEYEEVKQNFTHLHYLRNLEAEEAMNAGY
jgi:hypothetical protein